jgi:hypothetical protein
MTMPTAVLLTAISSLLIFSTPAIADDGEWIRCPGVGVASRVEPLLDGGRVSCYYMHSTRSEILARRSVSSRSGKPFLSCLRDNSGYGKRGGSFTSSVFCSTSLSQEQLNRTAYKWAPWTGADKKLRRVRLGHTNKSGGEFYLCRVNYKGYRLGQMVGQFCEFYNGKSVVRLPPVGPGGVPPFDHLLLTNSYGFPTAHIRNKQSTISLDPDSKVPAAMTPLLCTTYIAPDAFDFEGIFGTLPGTRQAGLCMSHAGGKLFFAKGKVGPGNLAGLE